MRKYVFHSLYTAHIMSFYLFFLAGTLKRKIKLFHYFLNAILTYTLTHHQLYI